ncbi:carboxypeptidase-like regulatory domain-containing protein [Pseudofulvibacter geojedonensis]|uniref:Carboxypeptidase-like regulatory domain-containing protein n=1 Tax=Pseudofulvibacter geojedonensis TaxID=1123758 RepID=A0ABW3I4M8_9FLAO
MKAQKKNFTKMNFLGVVLFALFALNTSFAQTNEKTISGTISDSYGPIEDVNIVLKGTKTGTTTNEKGEFTFPKSLAKGDILIVSYLGYKTQNITITENTKSLVLVLKDDLIEIAGALNNNTPYKSKRSK